MSHPTRSHPAKSHPAKSPFRELDTAARKRLAATYPSVFRPDIGTRAAVIGGAAAAFATFAFGIATLDVSWTRVFNGFGELWRMVVMMMPPSPESFARFRLYLDALAQTLAIAFLGTLLAAVLAFPLGFLAARNVFPNWLARFMTRRFLDTIRSVDTLIWALIWINVVGLGPFAGILAIMTSDIGAFGKLFSEAIEAADRKPVEGVTSVGANKVHAVRFGLLPQVLPVMASQVLYYFESNTRSATIIGIVGAGGIGMHLYEQIKILEWQQVSFLVLMVLVTVSLIDHVSGRLRFAVIGASQTRSG